MPPAVQNIVLCLVSFVIAFAGVEGALRLWGSDVLAMGNQYVFYKFDPLLGWDNLPNSGGRFSRSEFSYPVQINSLGMRDTEVKPKQPGEFRVAVLGDSFTWGVGVSYGERFTEVVEARDPGINALNFGVSGFSPIQYLQQLDNVFALKPDYVVVTFCLGNDLTDNVSFSPYRHPKPYVVLTPDQKDFEIRGYPLPETKDTGPYLVGAASASRLVGMMIYLYDQTHKQRGVGDINMEEALAYVPPEKLDKDNAERVREVYKLNELVFAAIKKKVDAALGPGRLAVLLAPTKLELGEYLRHAGSDRNYVGDQVSASMARLGIPVIDGRPGIVASDFWKTDAHWRPSGHTKIGELLAAFLAKAKDQVQSARM